MNNTSEKYEEIDLDESHKHPTVNLSQKSKHTKYYSETFSTNCCTIDLNKTKLQTASKFYTEKIPKSTKGTKNYSLDFPDRLISFKQMLENKKKFLKLEQDLKDLEHCTFKPKTNVQIGKASLSSLCKKQLEYSKLKTPAKLRTKLTQTPIQTHRPSVVTKAADPAVHERLFKDSKILVRGKLQRTIN